MFNKTKQMISKTFYFLTTSYLIFFCKVGQAGLPPAPDNANFSKGDVIAGVGDYVKEAVTYGVPGVMAVGMIVYMYALISSFVHAKQRQEWGHFSTIAIVGAGVMILIFIFGNMAVKYFGTAA